MFDGSVATVAHRWATGSYSSILRTWVPSTLAMPPTR